MMGLKPLKKGKPVAKPTKPVPMPVAPPRAGPASGVPELEPGKKTRMRKAILLLGYNGTGYSGMQRQPKNNTIEEELLVDDDELVDDELSLTDSLPSTTTTAAGG